VIDRITNVFKKFWWVLAAIAAGAVVVARYMFNQKRVIARVVRRSNEKVDETVTGVTELEGEFRKRDSALDVALADISADIHVDSYDLEKMTVEELMEKLK